jgi:hypothetical protein
MKQFIAGLVIGMVFASFGTVLAARIIGGNGYLLGWTVTVDGEEACSDPYIWTSTREIECD